MGVLLGLFGNWAADGSAGPGLAVSPAFAQDYAAAGQHFATAQEAFEKGEYRRAAEEYQAAYSITKDGALLFNIGESWQRAGDGQKALAAYRQYLSVQKDQLSASDREEVEKRVRTLEAALQSGSAPTGGGAPDTAGAATPQAQAGATPPGAAQAGAPAPKGGSEVGTGPTAAAPTAGSGAAAPAVPPAKGAADGSQATTVGAIVPKMPPPSRLRTAGWVLVAVAVATATAGAIMGLGAQNRADELQRRTTVLVNNQPPVYDSNQRDAYETLMSEGHAYNTAGIALLSVAGATAVGAAALFIADAVRKPSESRAAAATAPRVSLRLPALGVGVGTAAVSVAGSF